MATSQDGPSAELAVHRMSSWVQASLFASWMDQQSLTGLLRAHHRRLTVSKAGQARALDALRVPRSALAARSVLVGESNVYALPLPSLTFHSWVLSVLNRNHMLLIAVVAGVWQRLNPPSVTAVYW
ncbi:hypothetical protein OG311_36465 [Streptomyces sp. NBC_01343]|uniref:hypothetical protein n=1 Tax=Streptomyces sp. NBC_01343 TaxID=2903832 RepID=UPI002E1025DC|nr:hypothetical protein OG311_36465 [Streptomyces sp. NBC_01343]